MKIIDIKKVEDCFDGSSVFSYWFDSQWTEAAIGGLSALGRLEYFADFPRPLFRLTTPEGLHVKGVKGEDNCRVIYPQSNRAEIRQAFERHFAARQQNKPGGDQKSATQK
ncbi:hypothetical protein JW859_13340 [bacterium]|nr:hypothetical protein [bacterium]